MAMGRVVGPINPATLTAMVKGFTFLFCLSSWDDFYLNVSRPARPRYETSQTPQKVRTVPTCIPHFFHLHIRRWRVYHCPHLYNPIIRVRFHIKDMPWSEYIDLWFVAPHHLFNTIRILHPYVGWGIKGVPYAGRGIFKRLFYPWLSGIQGVEWRSIDSAQNLT